MGRLEASASLTGSTSWKCWEIKCAYSTSLQGQGLLGFPMTLYRGISDSSLMKIDVSSEQFPFYLALTQSVYKRAR